MINTFTQIVPFLLVYLVPLLSFWGLALQGPWLWVTPIFSFILIPILDALFGDNLTPSLDPKQSIINAGKVITALYVPLQFSLILFGAYQVTHSNLNTLDWWLAAISVGLASGGIGITVAHELVHRSEKSLRTLGGILLSSVCYGHFMVEHVHGHHTWVATKKDPASSRYNESLYRFYVRTVIGSFMSALNTESAWMKKRNKPWYQNRILLTHSLSVLFAVSLYFWLGLPGLIFFLVQSWVAFSLLEIINYVEHYGLSRKELSQGQFEPVALRHSWDSRRKMSNWFLINLERHSDHHKYPTRDFTQLRFNEDAPLLPAGYPEMLLLSLLPPLWFSVMNKRVPKN